MTLRQRQPRQRNEAFLAWVRSQRCCACGAAPPVQAAHVRAASAAHDKRETGMLEKPDDRWAVPLCRWCHLDAPRALHRIGEQKFFKAEGIDAFQLANDLWRKFVSERTACRETRPRKRSKKSTRPKLRRKWPKRAMPKGRGFRRGR